MKHLLFYIPYRICKHSLISINSIASVYELFDNPSYREKFKREYVFKRLIIETSITLGLTVVKSKCLACQQKFPQQRITVGAIQLYALNASLLLKKSCTRTKES